jgi:predicted metalloprotease with PDZ domain
MKLKLIILLLCTAFNLSAQKSNYTSLTYSITVLPKTGTFNISVDFIAGNETSTAIQLPKEFGSFNHAFRYISILKGKNIEAITVDAGDSSVVVLKHQSNQQIRFQYILKNSLNDSLPGREPAYSIIIKPNYFNIPGQVLFAYPKKDSAQTVNIKINWMNYPGGWANVNSFGNNYSIQTLPAIPMSLFTSSIWCGGDFRVYPFTINKKPVYFAIRGKWKFKDEAMLSMLQKTIATQRAFWNDYKINQYTVTLMPFLTENEFSYSYQGTGLTNSFAAWATANKQTTPASLQYLYNHELMHHWIGHTIENEQPEELMYWFSEGFTDYFTWRNMLESKFITQQGYNRSFDSVLAVHYAAAVHQSPNTSIKEKFWTDYTFQKLPYNRGRIFAFYLDAFIKKETTGKKDLKAVMLELLTQCRSEKKKINQQLFSDAVKKISGADITALFNQFITEGRFISLKEWNAVLPDGLAYKDVSVFTYGFETDKGGLAADAKVISVDEESNVFTAGLQPGDILKGYNIYNNVNAEAELTVERNKQMLTFKFYPAKKVSMLQLK